MIETSSQHQKTQNCRGYMHPLSEIGKKFIAYSKEVSPVMDMGCAYGNLVIASLEEGAQAIIACDMEQRHLDQLRERLTDDQLHRVIFKQGLLPDNLNFDPNSIGAIHASHILEYLDDKEIDRALDLFYRWLKPGGKLFLKCYTIYIKELIHERFQNEYKKRLSQNLSWPGFLKDFREYSILSEESGPNAQELPFPKFMHMYDVPILSRALRKLGFELEFSDYLDGRKNGAMKETWYDGREMLGIIVVKNQITL